MSNTTTEVSALPGAGDQNSVKPATNSISFAVVIDDQESICRIVAAALTSLDVEFATYPTAKPAIASLDQRRPEIIFLDVALDNSDAIDVLKGLSEKHYTGSIQLMSGGRPSLMEAIQRIGARYRLNLRPPLHKPFQIDAIREIILNMNCANDGAPLPISAA
jgi:two-component system nitrogen regulation response regulator NtrX